MKKILLGIVFIFLMLPTQKTFAQVSTNKQAITTTNSNATINNANSLNALGDAELRLKHFVEALDYFNDAIGLAPTNATILNNRAGAEFALGRYAEAKIDLLAAQSLGLDVTDNLDAVNRAIHDQAQNALNAPNTQN